MVCADATDAIASAMMTLLIGYCSFLMIYRRLESAFISSRPGISDWPNETFRLPRFFSAQFAFDGAGDAGGEALHLLQVRALHHHPRQRLGAGEAHQHAARAGEFGFAILNFADHRGQLVQRLAAAYTHVPQAL